MLGYKYVHVDPPYSLVLRMTRHREVDVQTAAIDRADYRTLFTADGLAVTTAGFTVRNSRKQFLRVQLPKGAELWSATVDGKPEKPAISNGSAGADGNGHAESSDHSGNGDANGSGSSGHAPEILIKVINSVEGFPVELIYATPVSAMGRLGRVSATLPRPDMVVTRSRWDLYLPDRFRYGTATTNMDVVANGQQMNQQAMQAEMDAVNRGSFAPQQLRPLHIEVPSSGIHYAFEKLYANQSEEDASFSIPYASDLGVALGQAVALTGTAIFWAGLYLAWRRAGPLTGRPALGMAAGGLILLLLPIGYLQTSLTPPLVFSLFALLGAGALQYRASSAS